MLNYINVDYVTNFDYPTLKNNLLFNFYYLLFSNVNSMNI